MTADPAAAPAAAPRMRAAVLGSPIDHSLSPALHRAGYAALGLSGCVYERHRVDEAGLAAFLDAHPDHRGFSLTMPLKHALLELATARGWDVDPVAARAAAADDPSDVEAAVLVADLDVLGGHVDDAFGRLLDVVRSSSGDDRDRARTHLLELFAVVGNHDDRVRKGRTALMSALF